MTPELDVRVVCPKRIRKNIDQTGPARPMRAAERFVEAKSLGCEFRMSDNIRQPDFLP